jgi:Do/DeqQ family serine protease
MRRLWLIFAQAVTFSVAVLFVVQTLKPEWLASRPSIVPLQEAPPASAVEEAHRSAHSYAEAARKSLPAVVHIFTSKAVRQRSPFAEDPLFRYFFGDRFGSETQRTSSLGSGVIVSPNGFVLTNHHVVEAAEEIEVSMNDGRTFRARIVGTDPESDVAVLQIESASRLPAVTFARPESLQVGDVVLAIGNPFGVGQTVTMGIVSALGRSHLGINTFENFIQTDAAINPGNSGGALVDANGNLVGINTAIYSRSGGSLGIGFAIPVSLARTVMEQIIQTGSVTRGWVGVEVQQITRDLVDSLHLASADGTLIAGVVRGGPADRAGIKPGDVLLAIDGKPVKDPQVMLDTVASLKPGGNASFRVRRDKTEAEVGVTIGKRPPPARSSE